MDTKWADYSVPQSNQGRTTRPATGHPRVKEQPRLLILATTTQLTVKDGQDIPVRYLLAIMVTVVCSLSQKLMAQVSIKKALAALSGSGGVLILGRIVVDLLSGLFR